jgi:site-specific recombinase XerD
MRIVKTQKILYNRELRIRFITENEDADYLRLARKLPDCRWSNKLNSWHTNNIPEHIHYLNKVFPPSIRFIDITTIPHIPVIEEKLSEKRISIRENEKGESLILNFLYDHELTDMLKNLGAKPYEENQKVWTVRNDPEIYYNLNSYLERSNYLVNYENQIPEIQPRRGSNALEERIQEFIQILKSNNYEKKTIDQYAYNVHRFLMWTGKTRRNCIESLIDYIDETSIRRNLSRSTQNLRINAVKAYFHFLQGLQYENMKVKRPKKEIPKTEALNQIEAGRIIHVISNLKHIALFSIIYMTGIKLIETVSIKPEDIDEVNKRIFIRGRNGCPDRSISASAELLEKIEKYRKLYKPMNFLFEGYRGSKYSERSVQKALKKYVQKAGIHKKFGAQALRHSFAGNLISKGTEIEEIQRILGNSSRESTEKYIKRFEKDKRPEFIKV